MQMLSSHYSRWRVKKKTAAHTITMQNSNYWRCRNERLQRTLSIYLSNLVFCKFGSHTSPTDKGQHKHIDTHAHRAKAINQMRCILFVLQSFLDHFTAPKDINANSIPVRRSNIQDEPHVFVCRMSTMCAHKTEDRQRCKRCQKRSGKKITRIRICKQ